MPIIFVVLLCLKKRSTENKKLGGRLWFMHHLKQSGAFRQLTVFSPSPNRCFLFITSCFPCSFLYLLTENKKLGGRLWFMHHLKQSGAFRQLTVFSPSPNRCFLFITSCFPCSFLYLLFPKKIYFVLHSGFVKRYCVGLWSRLKPLMRLSVELAAQNFKLEVSNPPLCFSIPLSGSFRV